MNGREGSSRRMNGRYLTPVDPRGRKRDWCLYCRTISTSTALCTSITMCCPTHCASYCAPCQPLLRSISGWIRFPPPTPFLFFFILSPPPLPSLLYTGGPDVIRKEAWSFYRTISGARLCWELEEPKGPKATAAPATRWKQEDEEGLIPDTHGPTGARRGGGGTLGGEPWWGGTLRG